MNKLYIFFFLLMCASTSLYAQKDLVISGTVSDDIDVLPGVSVYVKNRAGVGTTTNVDGQFSIKADRGEIVVFSYIGYKNIEYFVEKSVSDLSIKMVSESTEMEEVIITGLGTSQRKISSVGAISTIDTKELQVPATNLANILGGRMPGIISLQTSGEPGKNISEFWIRGIGTFGANASALVLIDGLEGDLNSVDPADIESFSVLKDASATAVYGVRGANGVVLINTKRGEEGKLKISARVNYSISKLKRMPDYVGGYDYAMLANEARAVRGDQAIYDERALETIRYGLDPDLYPDIDWQDEIMKSTGFQQTYYLSAQGGGSIARYFLSLGTSSESAAYKTDPGNKYNNKTGYNTYSYRANLDISLTKTTKVIFSTDGYLTRKTSPGMLNTDLLWYSLSQVTPVQVPKRYSTGQFPSYGDDDNISPYVLLNHTGTASSNINTFKTSLGVTQDLSPILQGLKLRVQGAFDSKTWFEEFRRVQPELYYASARGVDGNLQLTKRVNQIDATYSNNQRQFRKYHLEGTLNYDKVFNEDHRFSALAYYYMSDSKDTNDIKADDIGRSMNAIGKRYQGLSSRLTYGFRDTYLLDFNFGYTGSENFDKGDRFGFFPSIALGWVPSQYNFVRNNLPWIDFFKIRGSYGTVGNDKISNTRFPYLTIVSTSEPTGWGFGSNEVNRNIGIAETRMGADNLKWEKATKADVGIDARFLKERLMFTIDWFLDKRDGIFQSRKNIPDYVGLPNMPYGNVGKMKSYGSDGNISYTHQINKDMMFTLRANYTYTVNEIENWEQATPKYDYQNLNGYPNNAMRGYISMGLFRDEEDVKSSPLQSFSSEVLPGDIKYKDVNGDGVINTDDQVVLSAPTYPRLMYGFGGEFQWKNLTFGFLFKGTGNNEFYYVGQRINQFNNEFNNGMGYVPFHGAEMGNVLTIAADPKNRWIPASYSGTTDTENPNARFPRLTYGYNANNSQLSDFWKGNKKYLRLQEVTVNYNWKAEYFRKIGISSVDLQVVGDNLYVWDDVKLFDPEQAQFNGRAYPIPLRITFQVYIHF